MSLALFALGGVMGFLITGSDMRTPAHYHAVITAVSVSSVGMLLTFGLDELGRGPASARATRILIGLYGGGQFVASIAMFVAGGYGAARKTPDGVGSLDAVAAAGMAVHGIASIFTIIGGAAFIVVAVRALWRPALARRGKVERDAGADGRRGAQGGSFGRGRRRTARAGGVARDDSRPGDRDCRLAGPGAAAELSSFVDQSGAAVSVDSFRGKILILNLWAPWCVPCLKEMPSLDRLAGRLPPKDFAIAAVTKDGFGDTPSKRAFDAHGTAASQALSRPQRRSGGADRRARDARRP